MSALLIVLCVLMRVDTRACVAFVIAVAIIISNSDGNTGTVRVVVSSFFFGGRNMPVKSHASSMPVFMKHAYECFWACCFCEIMCFVEDWFGTTLSR